MSKKNIPLIFGALIVAALLIIFLIRLTSQRELDDVTPGISCDKDLIDKSGTLWIIPKYNNTSILENREWCSYILSLNKTLGLHGVSHSFNEFGKDIDQEYLDESINTFEECFGFKPEAFKPPQLEISENNSDLIKKNGMELKGKFNQVTHKVYHCNDSDRIKNWVIDLF